MTKRLWIIHSWMGLVAGLALLVIGVTGSLLVFAKELETLVNPELMRVQKAGTERLPMDTLLAKANGALQGYEVTGWLIRHDHPELADVLYVMPHGSDQWRVTTIDPYTGDVLVNPRTNRSTVTGFLLDLHYTFFADHAGMLVTGVLAVLLCALGLTGLWLYRDFWRNFLRLRWRASGRIFFSDFHKAIGITSVAFNLLLGFTGAYWNFTHVIGEWIRGESEQPVMEKRLYPESLSLDAMIEESRRRIAGFRANFISLPNAADAPITLWGEAAADRPLRGSYGSTVIFEAQTGEFKEANDVREQGWWAEFVDMFEPLHFGNFGGVFVQIVWCVGGLTPGALAVSGALIWWTRTRRQTKGTSGAAIGGGDEPIQSEASRSTAKRADLVALDGLPARHLWRTDKGSAGDPNVSLVAFVTLVLWSATWGTGVAGFAVPYSRPTPLSEEPSPLIAEVLEVELGSDIPLSVQSALPETSTIKPPPLLDPPMPPDAPLLTQVAELTPDIAFPLPVEGPVRTVDAKDAAYSRPPITTNAVAAAPAVQALTFGKGEGRQPAPYYPREAIRLGQEGTVVVRLSVGQDGRVLSAEALKPSPWPLLNQSALRTVRERWRFARGTVRLYEVVIRFELTK